MRKTLLEINPILAYPAKAHGYPLFSKGPTLIPYQVDHLIREEQKMFAPNEIYWHIHDEPHAEAAKETSLKFVNCYPIKKQNSHFVQTKMIKGIPLSYIPREIHTEYLVNENPHITIHSDIPLVGPF